VSLEVDLEPLSSVEAVRDALAVVAHEELLGAQGRSIIARARLTGRSDVHAALQRDRAVPELLVSLRDDFRPVGPWCWWDRIDDASTGVIDLGRLRAGSDFAADLIAVAEELSASCAGPSLSLGLEAELPLELLDDITATLPKALRARAMASSPSARQLMSAALMAALDELGTDESLAGVSH